MKYKISYLAEKFGVCEQSIRDWESQKKIPAAERTPGGHRRYTDVHIAALESHFRKVNHVAYSNGDNFSG